MPRERLQQLATQIARLTRERDEARAGVAQVIRERDEARAEIVASNQVIDRVARERDRLRALLEEVKVWACWR